jgi:MFS family permease
MTHALARPAEAPEAPRTNVVVAVLAFSGIVVSLMQTLLVPLIPALPRLLNASPSDTAWVVTATLLAGAVATPVMGRLGDMYGKRRMLLVSLAILVTGSVVCALSDSLTPMVVGRALQGLAAGVIALGISIMRDELPAERLSGATALMSASLGVGGALGLPAAALLAEQTDWHVLFWVSAALGAVAALLVVGLVPESAVRSGGRFDVLGAIGLSAALLCLLLPISKGADWSWGSPLTIGLFGAAVVVLAAWGWWELRIRQPLVDLRTTARRQVLLTNAASAVFGFAMFAMSLVLPRSHGDRSGRRPGRLGDRIVPPRPERLRRATHADHRNRRAERGAGALTSQQWLAIVLPGCCSGSTACPGRASRPCAWSSRDAGSTLSTPTRSSPIPAIPRIWPSSSS